MTENFFDKFFWIAAAITGGIEFFINKNSIMISLISGIVSAVILRWAYGKWGWTGVIVVAIINFILAVFLIGLLVGAGVA